MLEDLDAIDWQHLTHAYGNASDVPNLIRMLASNSSEDWGQALDQLRGTIWHQGTVYEATSFAIPFLIELLQYDEVQCKGEILIDLAYLARGGTYHDPEDDANWYGQDNVSSWEYQEQLQKDQSWVKKARDAVILGLHVYLKLLKNAEPEVRRQVPYTLDAVGKGTDEALSLIYACIKQETDPQVKASLLIYLSHQTAYAQECENLLKQTIGMEDEYPLVRVVAALALAGRLKERTPRTAIQLLLETLARPQLVKNQYARLPWSRLSLLDDISSALLFLGFEEADLIIPSLLKALIDTDTPQQLLKSGYSNDSSVLSVVQALLHFALQGKQLKVNAFPFLLTTTQRAVLIAILSSEKTWYSVDSVVRIVNSFGLPPHWKMRILLMYDLEQKTTGGELAFFDESALLWHMKEA